MPTALVVGGTGFVGRHVAVEFLEQGYDITTFSRGEGDPELVTRKGFDHVRGDRTDADTLADVAGEVVPDVVVDCALYHPEDAQAAVDLFADVDAYVYVSSGATYSVQEVPKREQGTPLHDCDAEQATDDSMETYGPRKAECDRIVRRAAEDGVRATSVRPTVVYGPQTTRLHDHADGDSPGRDDIPATWAGDVPGLQTHHDYWIHRLENYDRVVVPGDGTAIWHRVYVEDLAAALRLVAESGAPGEAYNAADRRVCTLDDVLDLMVDALDTSVDRVYASHRELTAVDLSPNDFVLYHHPMTEYPHVLETCKLAALGWESTSPAAAMERTVAESLASNRTGSAHDPGRESEERLFELVDGE